MISKYLFFLLLCLQKRSNKDKIGPEYMEEPHSVYAHSFKYYVCVCVRAGKKRKFLLWSWMQRNINHDVCLVCCCHSDSCFESSGSALFHPYTTRTPIRCLVYYLLSLYLKAFCIRYIHFIDPNDRISHCSSIQQMLFANVLILNCSQICFFLHRQSGFISNFFWFNNLGCPVDHCLHTFHFLFCNKCFLSFMSTNFEVFVSCSLPATYNCRFGKWIFKTFRIEQTRQTQQILYAARQKNILCRIHIP